MANRKKDVKDKKGKGILLNLKPDVREQVYELASKEKRTVTSIIEEAIDVHIKNKLTKLNNGFDEFISNKDDFNLDKELDIL